MTIKRPDCFDFAMDFLGVPENDIVLAYVEELERDAARYRWARERGAWDSESFLNGLTPEEYDAEIDKRMAEDRLSPQHKQPEGK